MFARTLGVAARVLGLLTVVLGLGYTMLLVGIGAVVAPDRSQGSLVGTADGRVVGSSLIGQAFTDADGNPLPQWFQSRPSAAGVGYDGGASGGSNLGPENPDLIALIDQRRQAVADLENVPVQQVPVDAVTASGSGLDPQISPAYARLQIDRVAQARDLPEQTVRALVEAHVDGRTLGYLGEPAVNVLELNLALEELETP